MEKIAQTQNSRQSQIEEILSITDRRTRSRAIVEHTRQLKAASRARVQAMLLADGFTPRSLHHVSRQARRAA